MLLIGAIILTIAYYAILMMIDIKSRKTLRLAQVSKNAIGDTNKIYPEPKEEPMTTEATGNLNTENFFGMQQSHNPAEKEKESTPTIVSPVSDTVLEMSAEKEVTGSLEKEADTSSPGERNDEQTDEEKRRALFAGTQMARDANYEIVEPDSGEAGGLEMLAQEYLARINTTAGNHAPTKEKLSGPVQDLDRMETLCEEEE